MQRPISHRILTACLALGAAAALGTRAEAQDSSSTQTGQIRPTVNDTAPTTQAQGDTLGGDSTRTGYSSDSTQPKSPPGYRSMGSDTSATDSGTTAREQGATGASGASSASPSPESGTARDTVAPGDSSTYEPARPERRMQGDSTGAADSSQGDSAGTSQGTGT
jgi:hypothetical protein